MDTALATLLTTLAINAALDRRLSPDDCAQVFLDSGHPVPLVIEDEVYRTDPPLGLLLFVPALRAAGIDRLRIALIHPSLPYTVPRVDKTARRRISRSTAVAIAESRHTSHAIIDLDAEANIRVFACAPVPYATLDVISVSEAARALREVVIDGLALIETLDASVPAEIRNLQWRDWQADMSAEAPRSELAALLRYPSQAPLLHAAIDIHHAMSPILAPAAVQPPALGSLLSRLHAAAASVVTAISRDNGIG